jgi:hypothetical protein
VQGLALERFSGVHGANAQISYGEWAACVAVQVTCMALQIELHLQAPDMQKLVLTRPCFQRRFRLRVPVSRHEVHHQWPWHYRHRAMAAMDCKQRGNLLPDLIFTCLFVLTLIIVAGWRVCSGIHGRFSFCIREGSWSPGPVLQAWESTDIGQLIPERNATTLWKGAVILNLSKKMCKKFLGTAHSVSCSRVWSVSVLYKNLEVQDIMRSVSVDYKDLDFSKKCINQVSAFFLRNRRENCLFP